MSFAGLTLRDRLFSAEELCRAASSVDAETDNERQALDFCRRWLNGEQHFTVMTSGSTGSPKPISLSRRAMEQSARMTAQALGLQAGDRALVCLPVNHIAGMMMLVRGMVLGLSLTLVEPSANPSRALMADSGVSVMLSESGESGESHASVERTVIDFVALAPLQVQTILEHGADALAWLHRCKAVLVGGAPVSPALLAKLKSVRSPVYQTFAMTETVSHFALRRLSGEEAEPAYRALPGITIGQDQRGCLTVDSPLSENTLISNDLVSLLPGNRFLWRGRIDNRINSGGIKICPEEVEQAAAGILSDMGLFSTKIDVFVCGVPDQRLGQRVLLCLAGLELTREQEQQCLAELKRALGKFQAPRQILYLPQLPKTANGKIDRPAVLRQVLALPAFSSENGSTKPAGG